MENGRRFTVELVDQSMSGLFLSATLAGHVKEIVSGEWRYIDRGGRPSTVKYGPVPTDFIL